MSRKSKVEKIKRWVQISLMLPLMDLPPSLPGNSGDDVSDEIERAREDIRSKNKNITPPSSKVAKSRSNNLSILLVILVIVIAAIYYVLSHIS